MFRCQQVLVDAENRAVSGEQGDRRIPMIAVLRLECKACVLTLP